MFVISSSPKKFIPESQKEIKNPLTFIVVPPKRKDVLKLQELVLAAMGDKEIMAAVPISAIMNLYFESSVVGWENVVGEDNKALEFNEENFTMFNDVEILTELYSFIKELAESTEKN